MQQPALFDRAFQRLFSKEMAKVAAETSVGGAGGGGGGVGGVGRDPAASWVLDRFWQRPSAKAPLARPPAAPRAGEETSRYLSDFQVFYMYSYALSDQELIFFPASSVFSASSPYHLEITDALLTSLTQNFACSHWTTRTPVHGTSFLVKLIETHAEKATYMDVNEVNGMPQELRTLGKGGYGLVVAAVNRLDGRQYAIKKIKMPSSAPAAYSRLMREVATLARLQHAFIVRYFQVTHQLPSLAAAPSLAHFTLTPWLLFALLTHAPGDLHYDEAMSPNTISAKCFSLRHLLDPIMH